MIDGEWTTRDYDTDEEGRFQRDDTTFHNWIRADGSSEYPVESGRYHLYVAWACPWAHRTLITRSLKGLDEHISISAVHWLMGEDGWTFEDDPDVIEDPEFGADYLREIYGQADPNYTGRVTVPVLWDRETNNIVNNESPEIMRMFDVEFDELAHNDVDLYPDGYRDRVDETIDAIYNPINNGVYKAGFAESQQAHDEAVDELFEALDRWEEVLGEQRFVCGDVMTEADICLFTTLYRFDAVYVTHFKCNLARIADYPNLSNFVREIYQVPGVAETCNMRHIKNHYYRSHESVNPRRLVARGFEFDFEAPHDRDRLAGEPPL